MIQEMSIGGMGKGRVKYLRICDRFKIIISISFLIYHFNNLRLLLNEAYKKQQPGTVS